MNSNRRLLYLVSACIILYLGFSIIITVLHLGYMPLKRINLISDIIKEKDTKEINHEKDKDSLPATKPVEGKLAGKNFELYNRPKFITNFNADTTQPSLLTFLKKMKDLKTGKKRKVRIAYFGDSMIEGDLLTQTLRRLLQKEFGGNGVGFVPITSQVSKFRETVIENNSDGWQDENFKTGAKVNLFFSGHLFRSNGDWVEMRDQTLPDSVPVIEKNLLCGFADKQISIYVNDKSFPVAASKNFNRILLSRDQKRSIKVSIADERLPVYGISFESDYGIIVDNFSFRGISGVELNRFNADFLQSIKNSDSYYDLFVFQYGVNVMYHPDDLNFNWYAQLLLPAIKKIKNCFSDAELLVISTADRAFRYEGEYKSAIGIDSLIKTQASMAYDIGCNFYNQFETMGGHNSIVRWAALNPALARKDYVHPNFRGAEILAVHLFQAIMNDYNKYINLPTN